MDRSGLALRVDVLGSLALHVAGSPVDVPGLRRRALLALLALAGREGMSDERLVDALWPDDLPANAMQALYSHVSRLRGHLGPSAGRLERRRNGYRLRLEPFELDADAARRAAGQDPDTALALWRGPSLAEFRSLPALEAEALALDELELQVVDEVLQRRLDAGDRTVTVDAVAAASASPLRERTALLLVRALAADGRAAEAMAAAQSFRARLAEETGLDPTSALADLEQRVASGSVAGPAVGAPRRVARPDGPMVGRSHDREQVVRLLGLNSVVTLTGPGGVGKTRLALDIAADHDDGEAVVLGLAAVDRPERLCQAVVSDLGLRVAGGAGPDDVAAALVDRRLLLLLDNCEHLAGACRDLVVAIRRAAPGVRVLATSRVTLHVPGEYVVRLQPLPVPRVTSDLEALRRQPGVRAFVEHARFRRPGYDLDPEDAPDLVEVLRRLDGLPLGIELAARQVAVMPLSAVRERLGRALDLATGRQGADDERQRTLRATIDTSYRLLGEEQRALLRAVAPFPGGVDVATIEAVAEGAGDPLDLLHDLVDSSLLVADPATGRYRLLFTVRAYLVERLVEAGEAEGAHARFVDRCVAVAERIGAGIFGADEATLDRLLRDELDNLRAARDLADAAARVRITLAVNQAVTWRDLGEIWSWASELAEDPAFAEHEERAAILAAAAEAARLVGDLDAAERRAREALAVAARDGRAAALGRAWSVVAVVAHFRGDFAAARDAWLRGAEEPVGDASAFVGSAALAAAYGGDPATARRLLARAASLATCGSHRSFLAYVEGELLVANRPADSIPHYVDAIAEATRVGCTFVEGVSRVSLASARTRTGDIAGAADDFAHLVGFWRSTGQTTQLWTTARNAAELLAAAGRSRSAALVLVTADATPGAAAVDEEIASFSGRSYLPVQDLLRPRDLEEVRAEEAELGGTGVLDRLVSELRELATSPAPRREAATDGS
ncbi:ATPase [Nocardioides guangzhouensis]|uniref:ATPase n=1 Tax=Nocardioides guangzhouensis TaxID=2497878 RepID=A0A4Q4ZBG7_9ACTN|nr:BTAD domain-containing putative transcriptional regulator [Nocardioides guangzhouensis]RYP85340.1 ATPase [Nocardioides guangzhouensis]